MDRRLQEQQDAAEAGELHWAANKHKKPRPFYHWFAKVDHPAPEELSQRSSTSTVLSTTPQGLLPQTITMQYRNVVPELLKNPHSTRIHTTPSGSQTLILYRVTINLLFDR